MASRAITRPTTRPRSYVGTLASGSRVYVRDRGAVGLVFAVYADTRGDGRLALVARVAEGEYPAMRCAHGAVHEGSCWWAEQVVMSPQAYAESRLHWWTHVARARAEVVALRPTRSRS